MNFFEKAGVLATLIFALSKVPSEESYRLANLALKKAVADIKNQGFNEVETLYSGHTSIGFVREDHRINGFGISFEGLSEDAVTRYTEELEVLTGLKASLGLGSYKQFSSQATASIGMEGSSFQNHCDDIDGNRKALKEFPRIAKNFTDNKYKILGVLAEINEERAKIGDKPVTEEEMNLINARVNLRREMGKFEFVPEDELYIVKPKERGYFETNLFYAIKAAGIDPNRDMPASADGGLKHSNRKDRQSFYVGNDGESRIHINLFNDINSLIATTRTASNNSNKVSLMRSVG